MTPGDEIQLVVFRVGAQHFLKTIEDGLPRVHSLHVDHVDDDDAAQTAQS